MSKPGEHGTAAQAIEWACENLHIVDVGFFLTSWRAGETEEWPEYLAWLQTPQGRDAR